MQVGACQALVNRLGTGKDGATSAAEMVSQASRATQNLVATFGQERAARYQAALGNEAKRVHNADFINPNSGSQTQLRADDFGRLMSKGMPNSAYDLAIRVYDTVRGHGAPLTDAERAAIVRMGTTEANLRHLVVQNPHISRVAFAQIAASQPQDRN